MAAKNKDGTRTIEFINATGEDHPSLKDLYIHVLQEAADRWRDIGVLLLDPAILKVIEKDHPQDVMGCCKCMLEKWLESKPDGSWNQLLEALKSPCIQLNTLAQQIEQKLRKKIETSIASKDSVQAHVMLKSFDEIDAEFAKMTTEIKAALHKNNISVAVLIEELCATSAVSSKKVPIFDENISEKVKSIDALWRILKRFWNILDYDILKLVIKLADCSEAQKILENFLAKIDLSALEDDGLVLHYKVYEEKLTQPVLRVKVNAEKCTVDIKEKVKILISNEFQLKIYSLRLKGIKEGCVEFTYHISKAVMSYLLEFKVTGSIMADFVSQSIISLQINSDMRLNVPTKVSDMDEVFVWSNQDLDLAPLVVDKLADDLTMGYNEAREKLVEEEWPPVQTTSIVYVAMICYNSVQAQCELIKIPNKYESNSLTVDELKSLNSSVSDISKVFTANPQDITRCSTTPSKPPRRILIEGAAGIGKTMFAKEIIFGWVNGNILKGFKLVLLVSLGDPRVHEVESIKDLLQIFTGSEVPYELENYMLGVGGKSVAFVFDGFNEYPAPLQKNSLIVQIIKGETFKQSTVVVISRPTAAVFLHPVFDRRIEILGFSMEERDNYILQSLSDAPEKKLELDNYLKNHPAINDLCFTPKHLAIILYLFQKNSLPETVKDMNEFFVIFTVCQNYNNNLTTSDKHVVKMLAELPYNIYKIVLKLSNLAFSGLQNNKIVFSHDEIEKICPEFNKTNSGFGLMQTVQYYDYKETEIMVHFRFLCFTIQEYLAALHVSTLSSERQTSLIKQTFWDSRYYFMWMMYVGIFGMAALVPLVPTYGKVCMLNSNSTDYLVGSLLRRKINEDKKECLYLIRCYLEAKSNSTPECASLVFCGGRISLNNIPLLPHNISSLLIFMHVIFHTEWRSFELDNCNLRINSILDYAVKNKERLSALKYVDLSGNDLSPWSVYCVIIRQCSGNNLVVCGDNGMQEHVNDIKNSLQANANLKALTLCSIGIIGLESIKEILDDNTTLNEVNLSWKKISNETIKHREKFVVINRTYTPGFLVKTIDLCDENITDDAIALMAFGLFGNTTLKRLYLSQNNISDTGAVAIGNCLQYNKSLRELDISENKITSNGMNYLIECVEHISTLEYVDLSKNDSSPWGVYCVLIRHCCVDNLILCGDKDMEKHVNKIKNSLEENVKLKTLTLCRIGKTGVESIKEILVNNTTINEINLSWKKLTCEELRYKNSLLQTKYTVHVKSCKRAVTVNVLDDSYCDLPSAIDLSNSEITDDDMALLVFGLSDNVTVQRFDLSMNKIGASGMNYFLKYVSYPLQLEYVDLSGNGTSPWGVYCIILRICCLGHLTLCGDDGMRKYVKEITDSLETNAKIKSLALCSIGKVGVESIAQIISDNTTLCKLSLSYRKISSNEAIDKKNILLHTRYSRDISQLDTCSTNRTVDINILHNGPCMPTKIDLPNKNVNADLIVLIAFGLHYNAMVEELVISQNQISDDGARAIGNCLKSNTSLKKIDVSQNRITQTGMNYLQKCIEQTLVLGYMYVDLSGNCSSPWGVYCAVIRHCCVDSLTFVGDDDMNKYVQDIADSLQSNKCLMTLTLCNIGPAINSIGKVLAFNTTLHKVNLFLKMHEHVYSPSSKATKIIIHRKFNEVNAKSTLDEGNDMPVVIDVCIECSGLCELATTSVTTIAVALCVNVQVQKFNIVYKNTSGDEEAPSPWGTYCGIIKHCCSNSLTLCGDDRMKEHIREISHHLGINPRLKSFTLCNVSKNGVESIQEILTNNTTLIEVNLLSQWKDINNRIKKENILLHTTFPTGNILTGLTVTNKSCREVDINILHDDHHCGVSETVNMSDKNTSNNIATAIAFGLFRNTTVTKLDLSHNPISDIGAIAISDSLRSNNVLQELNLSQCEIRREGAVHVVDSLQVNSTLCNLDLSDNRISDGNKIAISEYHLFRSVLTISIEEIELKLQVFSKIKKGSRQYVQNTTEYNFSNKRIGDIGAQFISLFLLCNTKATVAVLGFSQTGISDDGAIAIGQLIEKKREHIKEVDLSQNLITAGGMLKWTKLVDSSKLEYVDLSDNKSSPWSAYCVIIKQCCVHSLTVCGDGGMKEYVKEISRSLAANKRVNSLTLHKIGKVGVESIKKVLVSNTTLGKISLLHKMKFKSKEARNKCEIFLHNKWQIYAVNNTVTSNATTRMVDVNILDLDDIMKKLCTNIDDEGKSETIDLSNKSINDDLIALITFGLYNNTTVKQLYISQPHTNLTDYGIKAIDNCLRNNSTLRELDLSSSGISCSGMNDLLNSAQNRISLRYVDLSGNDDSPWIVYCVIIRNCCLNNLTLCGDNGMVEHVKEIADNLNANVRLESLVLCGIGRTGIKAITEILVNNTTLNKVSLSYKKIDNKKAIDKPGIILYTKHLFDSTNTGNGNKEIDINILYYTQCKCMPQIIDLSENDIDDDSITVLAFGLNNNTTVRKFNVSQNNISDYGAEVISNCLENNVTLKELDMSLNKISSNGMNYLRAQAEHMSTLEYIDLSGNTEKKDSDLSKNIDQSGNHLPPISPWGVYCAVMKYSSAGNLTVCGDNGIQNHTEDIVVNLEMNRKLHSLTLNYIREDGVKTIKEILTNNSTLQDLKFSWGDEIKPSMSETVLIHRKFGLLDDETTVKNEHMFGIVEIFIRYDSQYEPLMAALVNLLTGLCKNTAIQRLSICYDSKSNERVDSSPWSTYCRMINNCHISNLTLCGDTGMNDHIEDIVDSLETNARIESLTLCDIGRTGVKSIKDVLAYNTTLNEVNLSWTEIMSDELKEKNILVSTNFLLDRLENRVADNRTRVVDINVLYDGDSQSLSEVINLSNEMIDDDMIALIAFGLCCNTTVQILDVSHNDITDDGAAAISECLVHNYVLQSLNMSANEITLSGAMELVSRASSSLEKLNISGNYISDQDIVTIQDHLKKNGPQGLIVV
ncbi:protein NLRC5-like isoform X2 [Dysidea avara]|uniref:protein NLRC5-like isoform X2 n=1 Tax=Dysidea avara TaxID=196820 RepID=UPI003332DC0F